MKTYSLLSTVALLGGAAFATAAAAQSWPERPVTIVVPWAAGGGADPLARMIADEMTRRFGQPFIVDFRPGAAGTIGATYVAGTDADGYTLLFTSPAPLVNANYMASVTYEPQEVFETVIEVGYTPHSIAATATFPANDFAEFVEYARANPGVVNSAISGVGGLAHQGMALVEYVTGIETTQVPYAGQGPMLPDLMSGAVDIATGFPIGFLGGVEGGQLKYLAILSEERLPGFPDVPTAVEQGFPDLVIGGWMTLFTRTGTPREVVDRLNAEINDFIATEAAAQRINELGYAVIGGSPEDAQAKLERDLASFAELYATGTFPIE